jgi:hypothetical protein
MVGDGGHRLSATCRSSRVIFFFFFFLVFRFWPFAKKSHPSSRLVGRPYATATQRSGLHVVASRRPSPTKRPKEEETRRHQQQQLAIPFSMMTKKASLKRSRLIHKRRRKTSQPNYQRVEKFRHALNVIKDDQIPTNNLKQQNNFSL